MTKRSTRIPTPIYAAAGAGDLAYRQLRRLPTVVTELGGRAAISTTELRERAATTTQEFRNRAVDTLRTANTTATALRGAEFDVDRLREVAVRNAAAVVSGAFAAQGRALALYGELVARGERVVGTGVVQAADTVNADMVATEAPAGVTAGPAGATDQSETTGTDIGVTATPADVAEAVGTGTVRRKPTKSATVKASAKSASTPSAKLPATRRTRRSTEQ